MNRQLVLLSVLLAGAAVAAVPRSLTQHGRLFDGDGAPITGEFRMKFSIYNAPTGGTPMWSETVLVPIADGYFVASLGDVTAFPPNLFGGAKLYLGITVNDDDEMSPREVIASVPYALVAGDVSGDIHPDSVSVGGAVVIDSNGNWVGPSTGLVGPMGPTGATGATGPIGLTGPAGAPGADGATGPRGADGPQGPAGASVVGSSLNVGDVDCPMGGAKFVIGTSVTFACNGAPGAQGLQGAVGPAGSPGTPGLQGPQGAQGPQGLTGAPGAQGPQGLQGLPGVAGPQGPAGAQGPQGVAGAPGAPGAPGATGATGATGAAGATGAPGPQGPQGATGPQGPPGSANMNGTTNFLVKFTGATSGGNSLASDNGTGIGIGVPNASYPLQVSGGAGVTGLFTNTTASGVGLYGVNSAPAGTAAGIGVVGVTAQTNANSSGVWAQNNNTSGTGLIGFGNNDPGATLVAGSGAALNGTTTGVFARNSSLGVSTAIYSDNGGSIVRMNYWNGSTQFKINGAGTVSTVVKDPTHPAQKITLYAPEAPEILFTDYGTGRLRNGRAHVELDPRFSGNVLIDSRHPLRVFVQLEGDESSRGVIVTKKTATGFDVVELDKGRSNATFQWQATANRADELLPGGRLSRNADTRFGVAEPDLPQRPAALQPLPEKRPVAK